MFCSMLWLDFLLTFVFTFFLVMSAESFANNLLLCMHLTSYSMTQPCWYFFARLFCFCFSMALIVFCFSSQSINHQNSFLGNSHVPSQVVKAIMQRFSANEVQRMSSMDGIDCRSPKSFRGIANTVLAHRQFMKWKSSHLERLSTYRKAHSIAQLHINFIRSSRSETSQSKLTKESKRYNLFIGSETLLKTPHFMW